MERLRIFKAMLTTSNTYVIIHFIVVVVAVFETFTVHCCLLQSLTCDFSMVAVCLSHMGEMSMPWSLSRSPCWKNSSMIEETQFLYNSRGLVGLLRSAQWTMFCST